MASPDPAVVERQMYLDLLQITDDPTLSISDLKALTGGGARVDLAANQSTFKIFDTKLTSTFNTLNSLFRTALDSVYSSKLVSGLVASRAYTPEQFGAIGDGVADDTVAFLSAVDAANNKARTGIAANIIHPGATLELRGQYNLASLVSTINIRCNVKGENAAVIIPAAYADIAFLVGDERASGNYLQSARIHLPDIVKPTGSAIVVGSVGCRVSNFGNSSLSFGRILYFDTAQHYTGWGQGAVYLDVFPGYISYCKTPFKIKPDKTNGWANQIIFRGGSVQQSSGYAGGTRLAGWTHLEIDGNNINNVDEITFIGTSFEGDVSLNWASITRARNITFINCRHEQGVAGAAVVFAGAGTATITWSAHGLVVGDMVAFTATTVPTGLSTSTPYFVTAVPDANTINIAQSKGGSAVTFSTAGSGTLGWRPPRLYLDSSNTLLNIQIDNPYTLLGIMEVVDTNANGTGIGIQRPDQRVIDAYQPADLPLYMARNRASSSSRPAYAAYPPAVKPWEAPRNWTTAIGDRGLIFASSGLETALLYNSGGILTWQRAGQSGKQIGTMVRASGISSITALSCAANSYTTFDATLTGAATNDYAGASTVLGALPAGLIFSHAYVSATDTVRFAFYNTTGASISLTVGVQAMVVSRFF